MIATTSRRPCCFLSERLFVVEVAGLIAGYFGPTFPADQLYFLPNAPDPGSPSCQLRPDCSGSLLFLARRFCSERLVFGPRSPAHRCSCFLPSAPDPGRSDSLLLLARRFYSEPLGFGPRSPAHRCSCFLPTASDPGSPSHQPQAAGLLLFLGLDLIAGLSAFFHQFGHLVGGVGFPET